MTRAISGAMQAHLDSGETKLAYCLRCERLDGQVFGFTAHDQNMEIGGVTYWAMASVSASDVASSNAFDVANMEAEGSNDSTLDHPLITAADLRAGLWDGCAMRVFLVNWSDLTMGTIVLQTGAIGEVTMQRGRFRAEFRSMIQGYSRSIGRIYAAACDATLGDARCGKDLTAFTFEDQVIYHVSDDNLTLYILGRAEDGPSGAVEVTNITQAEFAEVTTLQPHDYAVGMAVVIAYVEGMTAINTAQYVREIIDANHFTITTDTTEYEAYTAGGTVVAVNDSGFFDYGKITFNDDTTGGANAGITRDIKAYVPQEDSGTAAQFMLQEAFPYQVLQGDVCTLVAGCNKLIATCIEKFDNVANHRGFAYLKGQDKLLMVGRS